MVLQTFGVDAIKKGMTSSSFDSVGGAGGGENYMKAHKKRWRTGIVTFATNTTLHGVRYMASNIGCTRKCFWLLLVLLCSSYMSVQIIERVVQYYRYPTTVNVKINFNKTLSFPALTICNQNAFRATAAADGNIYGLIEDLFSHNTSASSAARRIDQNDAPRPQRIDIGQLYTKTSHSKEDLIVECKWQDTFCGPENFTEIITDHGVCYTFNHDNDDPLWISSAGSEHGIKLTLNVEQYEYMPGPHDAAGVKLLLHDGKEFPSVANLGLSIPTGAHAYVGMQLVRVENLPKPHGTCSSESSPYYKSYSPDACQLACFTEFMATECGCRDMYMPHLGDYPPVCTLDQYINCFKPMTEDAAYYFNWASLESIETEWGRQVLMKTKPKVHRRVEEECFCPVPCNFLIYDSIISFSATSAYAQERLLATATTESLQQKYLTARETTSRMNPIKFNQLLTLDVAARSSFQDLEKVMTSVGFSHVSAQKKALQSIYENVKSTFDKKLHLLKWQAYHVDKNFIRARQAMEERTLFSALLGFQQLGYQVEIRIHQMVHPPSNITLNEDLRLNLYLETMNMINGRIDLCDKAFDNYTQLYNAYLNGTPIFKYKFYEELREENIYITPKKLLRESLFRTEYTRNYSIRIGTDLRDVQHYLRRYSAIANISFANSTLNETDLHFVNVMFFSRTRWFYQSRSEFYKEAIEYPARFMKSKIEDFERRWRSFENSYQSMMNSVNMILSNLVHLNNSILRRIKQGMDSTEKYIKFGNVTKQQAAQELTSEAIHVGLNDLKIFFHELRSRGQDIYDGWSGLLRSTNDIWDIILHDDNMQEFYEHRKMTEWQRDFDEVCEEFEVEYTRIRDVHDPRFIVKNTDTRFLMSMEKLIDHMTTYRDQNRVDSKFITDNFLQLDVFYREKSYEQITQQRAYDIFALICDIGGSMGLFIGASVLTLYEMVELFLHVFLLPLFRKSRKALVKSNKKDTHGSPMSTQKSCKMATESGNLPAIPNPTN